MKNNMEEFDTNNFLKTTNVTAKRMSILLENKDELNRLPAQEFCSLCSKLYAYANTKRIL